MTKDTFDPATDAAPNVPRVDKDDKAAKDAADRAQAALENVREDYDRHNTVRPRNPPADVSDRQNPKPTPGRDTALD